MNLSLNQDSGEFSSPAPTKKRKLEDFLKDEEEEDPTRTGQAGRSGELPPRKRKQRPRNAKMTATTTAITRNLRRRSVEVEEEAKMAGPLPSNSVSSWRRSSVAMKCPGMRW